MASETSSPLEDYKKKSFKELCTTLSMVGEAVDLLAKNSKDLDPEEKLVLWTERLQTLLILMGCMLYQKQAEFGEDKDVNHHYEVVKRFLQEGASLVKNDFGEISEKMKKLSYSLHEAESKLEIQDCREALMKSRGAEEEESRRKRGKTDVVELED